MAKSRYDDLFDDAVIAFKGQYKDELNKLLGMSKDEIDSITPGTADLLTYDVLIKVIEKASKDNLSQAELISNIKSLGDVAIKIAKKIPQFTKLL